MKVAATHCIESALWMENAYYRKLFQEEVCYTYKTAKGETGEHCYKKRPGQIYTPRLAKHFTPDELSRTALRAWRAALSAPAR